MIEIKKGTPPNILLEKQKIAKDNNLNPNEAYALLNHENKQVVLLLNCIFKVKFL